MIHARGPLQPVETATLSWSDAGEPQSNRFDDCYFSAEDGVAESTHVFLEGSNFCERLPTSRDDGFRVGELGFGSGLNFLLTWQAFEKHAKAGQRLLYWSVDRYPLSIRDLERALQRWPRLAPMARELIDVYPPPLPGVHRRVLGGGRVVLDLLWADASDALQELASLSAPLIDAWYLDGFAPARNSSMWAPRLYSLMASASREGATVATFSAAGDVRRGLAEAGFTITRRSGFGRKRQCIKGALAPIAARPCEPGSFGLTPWDLSESSTKTVNRHVMVLGAGLAGAHTAAALARRGLRVTVVDERAIAARGSGNAQGVLFTRLSHERSALSEYSLLAFLHAREIYRELFANGRLKRGLDGELNGCLQTDAPRGDENALIESLRGLDSIALAANREEVSERLGIHAANGGFWQPGSGWLSPPAVCRALLDHPLITTRSDCGPLRLAADGTGNWLALNGERVVAAAPLCVVAAGSACGNLLERAALPLRVVRGQTTQIPAPPAAFAPLPVSFCHRGYIAPARLGEHCIGATFKPGDSGRDLRVEEHQENIVALAQALPGWQEYLEQLDPSKLTGRAELRCVSPDYLPLAGPVPDTLAFRARFEELQWDARRLIPLRGVYLPGLYLSTAHGSRGLSYAALGAELIASQLCAEPAPLSRELQRAVSPARFMIRELKRSASPRRKKSA